MAESRRAFLESLLLSSTDSRADASLNMNCTSFLYSDSNKNPIPMVNNTDCKSAPAFIW